MALTKADAAGTMRPSTQPAPKTLFYERVPDHIHETARVVSWLHWGHAIGINTLHVYLPQQRTRMPVSRAGVRWLRREALTFQERSARLAKFQTWKVTRHMARGLLQGKKQRLQEVDDPNVHSGLYGKLRKVAWNFTRAAAVFWNPFLQFWGSRRGHLAFIIISADKDHDIISMVIITVQGVLMLKITVIMCTTIIIKATTSRFKRDVTSTATSTAIMTVPQSHPKEFIGVLLWIFTSTRLSDAAKLHRHLQHAEMKTDSPSGLRMRQNGGHSQLSSCSGGASLQYHPKV
jgi:hypothetical protein